MRFNYGHANWGYSVYNGQVYSISHFRGFCGTFVKDDEEHGNYLLRFINYHCFNNGSPLSFGDGCVGGVMGHYGRGGHHCRGGAKGGRI